MAASDAMPVVGLATAPPPRDTYDPDALADWPTRAVATLGITSPAPYDSCTVATDVLKTPAVFYTRKYRAGFNELSGDTGVPPVADSMTSAV